MHYEINVSLNGHHFFATHERSITTEFAAKKVLAIMVQKFPASEGFQVDISLYESRGRQWDANTFLKK